MIDVDNYFKDFKPHFNEKRFKELLIKPQTSIMTDKGNIYVGRRMFKSILVSCKMLWKEFDRNNIYYGGEGGGKSHTVFQHTYAWWWILNELGMINYQFGMHLIYGRLKDLLASFDLYANIPFMIFTLDESDDLNRKNWNKPIVKETMSKLRKERKNLRIVNLLMPAIEEMLPAITLSRIAWIIEIDVDMDINFNIIRGKYSLMNIPLTSGYVSPMHKKYISRREVKAYLSDRLYNNSDKYSLLPRKLLSFTDNTNSTFMFDKEEYKQWARDLNAKREEEDNELNEKDKLVMQQRDRGIIYMNKELGITQSIIGKVEGLSTSAIGKIIQNHTTTTTSN
jgi:hypothetical protein